MSETVFFEFTSPSRGGRGGKLIDNGPSLRLTIRKSGRDDGQIQLNVRISASAMRQMRWMVGDRASAKFVEHEGKMGVVLTRTSDGFAISGSKEDKGKMRTGQVKFSINQAQATVIEPMIGEMLPAICGDNWIRSEVSLIS